MTTTKPSGRIDGLDAWRAILMLGGLFIHATSWQEQRPLFDAIVLVSNSFRMGCFFLISGLLCGLAIEKRNSGKWLRRRLVRIGVPTVFGLLVLCPFVSLILYRFPPAGGQPIFVIDWYHLWFLVALIFYSALTYLAHEADRRWSLARRIDAHYGSHPALQAPVLVAVGALSFILMILGDRLAMALSPPAILRAMIQFRLIAGYVPDYLLGFALARATQTRSMLLKSPGAALLVLAIVGLLYVWWFGGAAGRAGPDAGWWEGLIRLGGASFGPPAAAMLILRSAITVRRVPRALRALADASFTIYIVHFPIILAMNLMFERVGWSPYVEYAIAILVACALSYALHRWVVLRSGTLSLLLNGKTPARPAVA